jgi:hypothetical protein
MSKLHNLQAIVMTSLLWSCVSTQTSEQRLQSWRNERADSLIQAMGEPTCTSVAPDGGKIYTYEVQREVPHVMTSDHRGMADRVVVDYTTCTVHLTVDTQNRLKNGEVVTQSSRCVGVIPENPNKVADSALAH